jgi:hypothetical protein
MSTNEKKLISKKLILEALLKYRDLFNRSPDPQALELYADMLAESFEFKQVTWALTEFVKRGSTFFPSCGEIFGVLAPKEASTEDRAAELVNEIISKATLHGYMQIQRSFNELSPEAQAAVGGPSFLLEICNTPYDNLGTMKAQLRRMVKASLERTTHNAHNARLEQIGIGNVVQINNQAMRPLGFNDFNPPEQA